MKLQEFVSISKVHFENEFVFVEEKQVEMLLRR